MSVAQTAEATASRPSLLRARMALARAHHRIGTAGWVGCLLLLVSLIVTVLGGSNDRVARLGSAAHERGATAPAGALPRSTSVVPEAAEPTEMSADAALVLLASAAAAQGLEWRKASYVHAPASESQPARIDMETAVHGPYLQIRAFIASATTQIPNLSMRSLRLFRETTAGGDVAATLSLSLLYPSVAPEAQRWSPAR